MNTVILGAINKIAENLFFVFKEINLFSFNKTMRIFLDKNRGFNSN
jgi:hypothetical protein